MSEYMEDAITLLEGIDYMACQNCLGELLWERKLATDALNPERICAFLFGLNRLSDQAKQVVRYCLDCPSDLAQYIIDKETHCEMTIADLRDYLRFHGWSYWCINESFDEIKIFLSTL